MKEYLSKKGQDKLKCICGLCKHTYKSSTCLYNKIIDSRNPDEKMYSEINKLFKEESENVVRRQKRKSESK